MRNSPSGPKPFVRICKVLLMYFCALLIMSSVACDRAKKQAVNSEDNTIHFAARHGDTETVRQLAMNVGLLNSQDKQGRTALHWAAIGHTDIVEILLESGADVNVVDARGETPLHVAARWGKQAILQVLVQAGSDVHIQNKSNKTALALAIREGHSDAVETLTRWSAKKHLAAMPGGEMVSSYRKGKSLRAVAELLAAGADPNVEDADTGQRLIDFAAATGDLELIRLLVEYGASAEATSMGESPLCVALSNENWGVAEFLLQAPGVRVDRCDSVFGQDQPLCIASINGNAAMVRLLLKRKAVVNIACDEEGMTPLSCAALAGSLECIDELVKAGADIGASDASGWQAIHYAAAKGNTRTVEQLLRAGANADAVTSERQSPLHLSVNGGFRETVHMLVAAGAEATLRDSAGKSPCDYARDSGNSDLCDLLKD